MTEYVYGVYITPIWGNTSEFIQIIVNVYLNIPTFLVNFLTVLYIYLLYIQIKAST